MSRPIDPDFARRLARRYAHPALVRGENGGLQVRRFATAADAMAAARGRELLPPANIPLVASKRAWTARRLAKRLGLSATAIARRCREGEIPAINMGTAKMSRWSIAPETVREILISGLRGVALRAKAGACEEAVA